MSPNYKAECSGLLFWGAVGVFVLCASCGLALFGLYAHYFPSISGVRDDWNVFAALLGGFGSCIGAVATLATLLFLAHQNKKQQEFVQWQVQTLTFEKFLSHRRVFGERLAEVQSRYDHKIRFHDPETLYYGLFPANGPANLDLSIQPKSTDTDENLLGTLRVHFEQLDALMVVSNWPPGEVYKLATLFMEIVGDLGYALVGEPDDGDIVFGGMNTGVNIFSLHEAIYRSKWIYNVYLRFTGNPPYEGLNRGVTRFVREALMQDKRLRRFVVYKSVIGLSVVQDLFFDVDALRDDSKNWLLPDTYRRLEATFVSREDVARLKNPTTYSFMLAAWNGEIVSALSKLEEDDPRYERLRACQQSVLTILEAVRRDQVS